MSHIRTTVCPDVYAWGTAAKVELSNCFRNSTALSGELNAAPGDVADIFSCLCITTAMIAFLRKALSVVWGGFLHTTPCGTCTFPLPGGTAVDSMYTWKICDLSEHTSTCKLNHTLSEKKISGSRCLIKSLERSAGWDFGLHENYTDLLSTTSRISRIRDLMTKRRPRETCTCLRLQQLGLVQWSVHRSVIISNIWSIAAAKDSGSDLLVDRWFGTTDCSQGRN